MKRIHYIILLLCAIPVVLIAQEESAQHALYQEGMTAYQEADYPKAITLFQQVLDEAPQEEKSADKYYNLGCAYFKNGDIAESVLQFERAYRLAPSDPDIKFNLTLATSRIEDKMEPRSEFFLTRWLVGASHWMGLKSWLYLGIITFIIAVIGFVTYAVSDRTLMRKIGFFGGIALLVVSLFANVMVYHSNRFVNDEQEAIVMADIVTVKSSPDHSSEDIVVIHSGLKVEQQRRIGSYVEVMLPDGTIGWVQEQEIETINNF
ncbi:MAG: tetratricopeptide repeat protein [Porphyromonas sp.]|nr:tetratricopeptide repeat protein [Porphyromonas sp.]